MENKTVILQKAFIILECLGEANYDLSLDDVSGKTEISKSTVFRILTQLVQMGYVDKYSNRYQLGIKLLGLAKTVLHSKRNIRDIIHRYMIELRDTYNETVNFALWDNKQAIYFASEPSRHVFRIENRIGQALPFHCMSIGKIIAAYLPEDIVRELLEKEGMEQKTENTITDVEEYLKEIREVKKTGYALDLEECYAGVKCIAVPVFGSRNIIFAGMSISGPATRMDSDRIQLMVKDLQLAGYKISFELSSNNIGNNKSLVRNVVTMR